MNQVASGIRRLKAATENGYDVEAHPRTHFPILSRKKCYGKPLVYPGQRRQSAQKPRAVIDAMDRGHERTRYSNVHRGIYYLQPTGCRIDLRGRARGTDGPLHQR